MNMSDEVVMMPKRPEMASLSLYYLWKSWNGMFVVSIKRWLIKIRGKKKNLSSASTHRIISCILNIVLVIFTKSIRIFGSWDLGESFIFNVGRIPKRKMREKYYYCKNTFTLVQSTLQHKKISETEVVTTTLIVWTPVSAFENLWCECYKCSVTQFPRVKCEKCHVSDVGGRRGRL